MTCSALCDVFLRRLFVVVVRDHGSQARAGRVGGVEGARDGDVGKNRAEVDDAENAHQQNQRQPQVAWKIRM